MITAVDTSVLLDVFASNQKHQQASREALRKCMREGRLIVCEVVVAELRPCFKDASSLEKALDALDIEYVPMEQDAAAAAGEAWKKYRESGGKKEHMIPDFLVAAHAMYSSGRLLTRDRGFYSAWFSGLKIMEP
jgi:predicted nucleic acid-binding protein